MTTSFGKSKTVVAGLAVERGSMPEA